MAFDTLPPAQRVVAVHIDFMRNKDFCILGGVTQIGAVHIDDTIPTAKTNGRDVWYGTSFVLAQSRKQLRYLVAHENLHKAYNHCTLYKAQATKYPELWAMAVDYVVNQTVEDMDTAGTFVERPTVVKPLIDPKYKGMSALEVLRELLKAQQQQQQQQPQPLDTHVQATEGDGDDEGLTAEDVKELATAVQEALIQGELMQSQLRGTTAGGTALGGFTERHTDWRGPLRRFIQEVTEGDDMSRYTPANRRMLPLDVLMPSHFAEATGELIIAADTSGSMGALYPELFGEVAQVCKTTNPQQVRLLWWDSSVAAEQVFKRGQYDAIAKALQPKGGGGTTASCVAQHITMHRYKPRAVIYLTDGYIESAPQTPQCPVLWGVFNNRRFVAPRGRVLHLEG